MKLNISSGVKPRAQKVVLYGPEGIGKTTMASHFPEPLFIDTEGGTSHMDVRRVDGVRTWEELLAVVEEVRKQDVCKTLVLDTMDWAEGLCTESILNKYRQKSIESFGYGKGYTYLAEEVSRLLAALSGVVASGKHVVILAHAKMRKQELPDEMGAFDRWELKLSKQAAPLVKEWADMVLFLNYQTKVITTESGSKKAKGGKRVMYASHHSCWDAKNRHGLDDEMDMDYSEIAYIFDGAQPAEPEPEPKTPEDELRELMERDEVSESDIAAALRSKGQMPEGKTVYDLAERLIRNWPKILKAVELSKAA